MHFRESCPVLCSDMCAVDHSTDYWLLGELLLAHVPAFQLSRPVVSTAINYLGESPGSHGYCQRRAAVNRLDS